MPQAARTRSRKTSASTRRSTASRSRNATTRRASAPARRRSRPSRSAGARTTRSNRANQSRGPVTGIVNGVGDTIGSAADTLGSAASKMKQPMLIGSTAAAALAGGIALGSRLKSGKKSFGMPVRQSHALRSIADDVGHVGKRIGKSGLRVGIGDVDMEVRRGKNSSNGSKSPIEVLLSSLTSRNR